MWLSFRIVNTFSIFCGRKLRLSKLKWKSHLARVFVFEQNIFRTNALTLLFFGCIHVVLETFVMNNFHLNQPKAKGK